MCSILAGGGKGVYEGRNRPGESPEEGYMLETSNTLVRQGVREEKEMGDKAAVGVE